MFLKISSPKNSLRPSFNFLQMPVRLIHGCKSVSLGDCSSTYFPGTFADRVASYTGGPPSWILGGDCRRTAGTESGSSAKKQVETSAACKQAKV